ncbi:hypothetical protein ACHHYP_08455 [Achlya hypogyna]|uniref:Uncharacterized protein n=1 Tax=Achlya hypogyna TaxID=1202772 RepID=A0A1V9YP83_ACHHY|nr:hypothetical protein ACHHYP_08455 [Achlya hypogyna]
MPDARQRIVLRVSKNHDVQRRRFVEVLQWLAEARAVLDIADTLVLENGEVLHWYTTSAAREVIERPPRDLNAVPIKRAFVKQSLRLESNVARKLAILHQVRPDGATAFRVLSDLDFNAQLCNPNARDWAKSFLVSRFVCGKFGPSCATHSCRLTRAATRVQTSARYYRPPQYFFGTELTPEENGLQFPVDHHMLHCTKELSSPYDDRVYDSTMRVVHAIEAASDHHIAHLLADFVLTATDQLVLVRIVYESDIRPVRTLQQRPTTANSAPTPSISSLSTPTFSCPGAFCIDGVASNETVAVAKKSIVWADHESHLLGGAKGTTTMFQSGCSNPVLAFEFAKSFAPRLGALESLDRMLVRRNVLLEQLQWFSTHAPALEKALSLDSLYDHVHVCVPCATMYQKLDHARRHRTLPRTEKVVIPASARLRELATPKHRSEVAEPKAKKSAGAKCLAGPPLFWMAPSPGTPAEAPKLSAV